MACQGSQIGMRERGLEPSAADTGLPVGGITPGCFLSARGLGAPTLPFRPVEEGPRTPLSWAPVIFIAHTCTHFCTPIPNVPFSLRSREHVAQEGQTLPLCPLSPRSGVDSSPIIQII